MINTDLLPGAPICFNLVVDYVAFTATNTAVWIMITTGTLLVMKAVAADGELTVTGTYALGSLISIHKASSVCNPFSSFNPG